MAKNKTQKTIKALVYLAIEKNMTVEIHGIKNNKFFSDKKEEIWKNYKHYSKGYIYFYKKYPSLEASYYFDIFEDKLSIYHNANSFSFLEVAEFLSVMYNN